MLKTNINKIPFLKKRPNDFVISLSSFSAKHIALKIIYSPQFDQCYYIKPCYFLIRNLNRPYNIYQYNTKLSDGRSQSQSSAVS